MPVSIVLIINIQGFHKVLRSFVFFISLGAQKKHYCQIKAEIVKFMLVRKKCGLDGKIALRHQG
jgi:hypothetical protein